MSASDEETITVFIKQDREGATLDELLTSMEAYCSKHNAYAKTLKPVFEKGKFVEWELALQKYPY